MHSRPASINTKRATRCDTATTMHCSRAHVVHVQLVAALVGKQEEQDVHLRQDHKHFDSFGMEAGDWQTGRTGCPPAAGNMPVAQTFVAAAAVVESCGGSRALMPAAAATAHRRKQMARLPHHVGRQLDSHHVLHRPGQLLAAHAPASVQLELQSNCEEMQNSGAVVQ